jgi:pullulanase
LFDKFSYFDESVDANLKRVTLANIVTVLSLGVPFIHMGQEIGQSKELLDNTYNIPKINNMNWKLVEERSKMIDVLADAIKLRKALNYAQANSIEEILDGTTVEHMDNGLLVIKTSNKRLQSDGEKAVLIININEESSYIDLEEDY